MGKTKFKAEATVPLVHHSREQSGQFIKLLDKGMEAYRAKISGSNTLGQKFIRQSFSSKK